MFASFFLSLFSCFFSFRHYIAFFPRQFRTNIYENILVCTHGYHGSVTVKVELLDVSAGEKVFEHAIAQIEPGEYCPLKAYFCC